MTASALRKSKILNLFWDSEIAQEWVRPIVKSGCDPAKAILELETIFDSENRMPGFQEVIAKARERHLGDRWITFEREVIGHGKRSFARQVPNDGTAPEDHLLPGETLLADTAEPPGTRCQWHECDAGRQFHAMFEKFVGKAKREAGKVHEDSGQVVRG